MVHQADDAVERILTEEPERPISKVLEELKAQLKALDDQPEQRAEAA